MSALASILIGTAAKVGAPMIKDILERHIGGKAGELGGRVIDVIAGEAGVAPEKLPDVSPATLERAIAAAEQSPELVAAYVDEQKAMYAFLLEQRKDGPTWTWSWLPGWQWFLMVAWGYTLMLVPIANAVTGAAIATPSIPDLIGLTTIYQILHMGGNTALRAMDKWKEARGR